MPAAIARARRERADRSTYFATTGAMSARSPGSDSEERPGHRCSSAAGQQGAAASAHRFSLSSSGLRDVAGAVAVERSEPTTPSTSRSVASGAMAQKPLAAPPFAAAAGSSSAYPHSARQRWQCPSASVGVRQPTDDACSGDQPQQRGIAGPEAEAKGSERKAEHGGRRKAEHGGRREHGGATWPNSGERHTVATSSGGRWPAAWGRCGWAPGSLQVWA